MKRLLLVVMLVALASASFAASCAPMTRAIDTWVIAANGLSSNVAATGPEAPAASIVTVCCSKCSVIRVAIAQRQIVAVNGAGVCKVVSTYFVAVPVDANNNVARKLDVCSGTTYLAFMKIARCCGYNRAIGAWNNGWRLVK